MIEVNNLTSWKVNKVLLRAVAKRILTKEKKGQKELSIALVTPQKAAELNRVYRRKKDTANVLSFPSPELGLGEVVLCPQQIKREAKKYDMMFEQALMWMLIHGILHLLGYDHAKEKDAKKMEQKELRYLSEIKSFNFFSHT